jgi:hypothetical protein
MAGTRDGFMSMNREGHVFTWESIVKSSRIEGRHFWYFHFSHPHCLTAASASGLVRELQYNGVGSSILIYFIYHPSSTMAFHQRLGKLVLMPAGSAAAAASASLLLGSRRYTSHATNHKVNHLASQHFNAIASRNPAVKPLSFQRSNFTSTSIAKSEAATTGNGTVSTNAAKSKGFVEWYEGHLNARPVITKAITGSILWGVGDVVAQVVPTLFEEESEKKEFKYDVPRTARAVTFGFAIHAPLSHLHFNFLEWMAVRGGFQGLSITVFKTIMEQVR